MAKQLLLGYTVLDAAYQNGRFMEVLGENPGASGNLSSIDDPKNTGIGIGSTTSDPVIFSYAWNSSIVRVLLGKITTTAGTVPSASCLYSLLESPDQTGDAGTWKTALASDVGLQYNGVNVATNPHGVAHIGSTLYIVDYDTQKIYLLGLDELTGQANPHPLQKAPYDLGEGTDANLPADAKGQAIIALANGSQNYLFVLYINANDSATSHQPGILVRLEVTDGSLSFAGKVDVGLNPQEIIPVTNGDKDVNLLIPAIGGMQGSTTNAAESKITSVPAFGSPFAATDLLTGDAANYDIRVIAASAKADDDSLVFILTANFTADWLGVNWKLYQTTVSKLLGAGGITLAAAITSPANVLSVADEGTTAFTDYSGVYFLDLLYENAVVADGKERLWFFQGSPLDVTVADAYGSPTATESGNAYKFYKVGTGAGYIWGKNVNSADLFAETIRQAAAGVSLKRGVRASKVPVVTARKISVVEEEK